MRAVGVLLHWVACCSREAAAGVPAPISEGGCVVPLGQQTVPPREEEVELSVRGAEGLALHCAPTEAPVDAVVRFLRLAVERAAPVERPWGARLLRRLCAVRRCEASAALPPPLTLAVPPLGSVTVEPWEEPASAVDRFARSVFAAGHNIAAESMAEMVRWFCARRECTERLASPLSLEVTLGWDDASETDVVARASAEFWEPPEHAARRFRLTLETEGVSRHVAREAHDAALAWFCERRRCGRNLHAPLVLDVWAFGNSSVGSVECPALTEPAECVEKFVRSSLHFGFSLPPEDLVESMATMMRWFCERRHCSRPIAPTVSLTVDGELLVVRPWEEPAKAAQGLAKRRAAGGRPLTDDEVRAVHTELCAWRSWCLPLSVEVGVSVRGVGNATCRSWEEPADVVESFWAQAAAARLPLTPTHLRETLQLMCSQRRCARLKLEPLATHLLMHPGKTAGRAINTALTTVSAVFVLGHDLRCDGRSRRCHVVLRDPVDRFVSALAFKKQGGEWRGERLLGNTCHSWLADKRVAEIVAADDSGLRGLNEQCRFANATAAKSTHCVFRPLSWWVGAHEHTLHFLCYETLQRDFDALLAPLCRDDDDDCVHPKLARQNPSDHSAILGDGTNPRDAENLKAFVQRFYAHDAALHQRHCGERLISRA